MMVAMIQELLREFDLGIDDIRWYLAVSMAKRLLEYKSQPEALASFIWSKNLEAELYDMEEEYLKKLEIQKKQRQIDESRLREIFWEVRLAKAKRFA